MGCEKGKLKQLIITFSAIAAVFFGGLLLCLLTDGYAKYSLAFLPFGLFLVFLFVLFYFLQRFLKDRKAKGFRFKFLTNLSARLAEKENRFNFYLSLTSIALFAVFFARYYFFKETITFTSSSNSYTYSYYDWLHLQGSLLGDSLNEFVDMPALDRGISTIFNDLWVALVILALVCSFYIKNRSVQIRRYIGSPIALLVTILFAYCLRGIVGNDNDYRTYLMGFELGFLDFYYFSSFLNKEKLSVRKTDVRTLIIIAIPFLLTSMSSYTPVNLFGPGLFGLRNPHEPENLTHRLMVYLSFILPILYFLFLSPLKKEERRGVLIQISLGTLFGYIAINRFDIWGDFSSWPMHLCNTAMYTMPITLLFKSYGLYYFTFFINVLGAFFAILMPNYGEGLALLHPTIVNFYINHLHAFFMPVLIVLLKIYERPKIKYFIYSQIGFLVYFAFVMFINVYLTAHGTNPDFFFINSDFIADKLGEWAKNLFHTTIEFTSGEYTYTIHLMYDIAYYIVYIFLAFGMWFLYELLFRVVDEFQLLLDARSKTISRHKEYLENISQGGKLMPNENGIYLRVDHLAKKYHGSDVFTVKDFSMNLEGGRIYGFLGKNGAGKSTIIKSIVGIHGFEKGSVTVCGHDVMNEPLLTKKDIGFVPDNYALYENLTGRQYINYIADLYGVSKTDRIEREEILVKRIELVERYDKPMKTYSHGMKQKITIIAALIHEPKVWILDEPMTGLDPNSIYQIKECMREHAKKGNIVFFSSHIIDVVKNLCDNVIIIKHGDLVKQIDLDANPEEREELEKTFLILTSDNQEETKVLLEENSKGQVI